MAIEAGKNGREFGSLAEELQMLADQQLGVTELTRLFGTESLVVGSILIDNVGKLGASLPRH